MEVLELLWQLQIQDGQVDQLEEELAKTERAEEVKTVLAIMEESERESKDLEGKIEKTEKELNRNNFALRDLNYKLQEIERDLYQGNISDLRQLEFLNKEEAEIRKEIDNKEIEIITQMEGLEALRKDTLQAQSNFNKMKMDYKRLRAEYDRLIAEVKEELIGARDKREGIAGQIQTGLIEEYKRLRERRGRAVAEIVDYKCGGCNVMLPTIIVDRLKFQNEIVHCENCGRILYYRKSDV